MTDRDDEPRFWFWAYFVGGDADRPYRVAFGAPCRGRGWYTRYEGDRAQQLLRYDRRASGFPRGAHLGKDGRWHPDERPERVVWLGSDYGDEVTPEQARAIAVEFGHDPAVVDDPTTASDRRASEG